MSSLAYLTRNLHCMMPCHIELHTLYTASLTGGVCECSQGIPVLPSYLAEPFLTLNFH